MSLAEKQNTKKIPVVEDNMHIAHFVACSKWFDRDTLMFHQGISHSQPRKKKQKRHVMEHGEYPKICKNTFANWFDNVMINHEMFLEHFWWFVIKNRYVEITKYHQKCSKKHDDISWHIEIFGDIDDIWVFCETKPGVLSWNVMKHNEFLWHVTNSFREVKICWGFREIWKKNETPWRWCEPSCLSHKPDLNIMIHPQDALVEVLHVNSNKYSESEVMQQGKVRKVWLLTSIKMSMRIF